MEVNKPDWPKGCLISENYKTVWWNSYGLEYGQEANYEFNQICKYRKLIMRISLNMRIKIFSYSFKYKS